MKWFILAIVALIAAAAEEEKDPIGQQFVPSIQQVCKIFWFQIKLLESCRNLVETTKVVKAFLWKGFLGSKCLTILDSL